MTLRPPIWRRGLRSRRSPRFPGREDLICWDALVIQAAFATKDFGGMIARCPGGKAAGLMTIDATSATTSIRWLRQPASRQVSVHPAQGRPVLR